MASKGIKDSPLIPIFSGSNDEHQDGYLLVG